jgi:hypothetical protein
MWENIPMTDIPMTDIPMPPAMARLPRDRRGYPVPFMVLQAEDNDGEPALAVLDPRRVVRALHNRLCAICGQALDYWIAFIGGDLCLKNRLFGLPMHEDCARFSMRVCPHLSNPRAKYRPPPTGAEVRVSPLVSDSRPSEMFLVITRRYKPVAVRDELLARIAPPARVERFE